MSSYRLSRYAEKDLVEIRDFIAQRNASMAVNLLDQLITRFEQLATRPLLGRSRDDLRPGLRSSLLSDYVVLYRETVGGVEIVRFVHGRRDLGRLV